VLAFVPFVLRMSAYTIGLIFFGWGVLLAVFSVVVAPRLQVRFTSIALAGAGMLCLAAILVAIAFGSVPVVIAAVVLSGAVMGVSNTVYTEMALEVSDAPRPVASAGYNFVRWFAGVIAPYAAPEIAERFNAGTSFVIASLAALIAGAILVVMRSRLGRFGAAHPSDRFLSSAVTSSAVAPALARIASPAGTTGSRFTQSS
jgi:ACDE family multidrug resistance protein